METDKTDNSNETNETLLNQNTNEDHTKQKPYTTEPKPTTAPRVGEDEEDVNRKKEVTDPAIKKTNNSNSYNEEEKDADSSIDGPTRNHELQNQQGEENENIQRGSNDDRYNQNRENESDVEKEEDKTRSQDPSKLNM